MEQLVQNISAAGGQTAAHMVAGVLGGHQTADIDQLEKGLGIPLLQCILLFPDDTGGRVQDVHKGLVLAVQVAHEMLGALGQLEQRLCADDLAGRRRLGRVVPRQQRQIFQMIPDLFVFGTHGFLPKIMQYSFTICNIHP